VIVPSRLSRRACNCDRGGVDRLCYRIIVEGEIGPRYAQAFDGMEICAADGATEITGPVVDQSALYGLLGRIADLGLTLRSVTPLNTDT
jgi:hypothetical protein